MAAGGLVSSLGTAAAGTVRQFSPHDVLAHAQGVGSIPSVILRDGTVCANNEAHPSRCVIEGALPTAVTELVGGDHRFVFRPDIVSFDGLFDLLGDGTPQVFIDYWPYASDPNCHPPYNVPGDDWCEGIALLVYRLSGNRYKRYLTLNAPTEGYDPAAWFLNESPRKAIFQSRCEGSSGDCFYFLNLKNRDLEPISDGYLADDTPTFVDVDHNGNDEILIPARGYDRTATQGAALLKWTGGTYRVWWPDWNPPPYVIYAQLARVGGDHLKEIVAELDSKGDGGAEPGKWNSAAREIAVWKLNSGKWMLKAKASLPPVADHNLMIGFPTLDKISPEPDGAQIRARIYLPYQVRPDKSFGHNEGLCPSAS